MDLHRNRGTCRRKELSAKESSRCDCVASWIVVQSRLKEQSRCRLAGSWDRHRAILVVSAGPNEGCMA